MNINRMTRALLMLAMVLCASLFTASAFAGSNEIAWSLKYDPRTLDPAKVDDQASETIRFLTGGVLVHVNHGTQQIEPELASAWSVSADGKLVSLTLRAGLRFSDGSALTSSDVVATLKRILDPATSAPVAEEFLEPTNVRVEASDALRVRIHLPKRVVSLWKVLNEIAIEPAGKASEGRVTAGSFVVGEYKRGEYVRLRRNPYYWKLDSSGHALPYLDSIRLDILANREADELRFVRGQYQLIESVPADNFKQLAQRMPAGVHDLGPSLNTEQLWFNQAASAPIPDFEKRWFQNRDFRIAISKAIHRVDLAKIAYEGHATPADDFISPANTTWRNTKLLTPPEDVNAAALLLAKTGFRKNGAVLSDSEGHPVRFSILTNAGNRSREKMAALIQQDLSALGIQVNIVTLDFPALIERLMHTQNYEAAMLGLSNVEPDPSSMMNLWMSSSPNHQWNPAERVPATPWEAEIDNLMSLQAATADMKARKAAVDRVQQIVADQQPFIYLVYPNALCAVSPQLTGVEYSVIQPAVLSNVNMIRLRGK